MTSEHVPDPIAPPNDDEEKTPMSAEQFEQMIQEIVEENAALLSRLAAT